MYLPIMSSYSYSHWNDEEFVEDATTTTTPTATTTTATVATVTTAIATATSIASTRTIPVKRKYTREERLRHEANRLEQERKDDEETRIAREKHASDPNAIAQRAASIAYLHHLDTTPWSLNF